MVHLVEVRNPFNLQEKQVKFIDDDITINGLILKENIAVNERPTVCILNGVPVLRKDWDIVIKGQDVCCFTTLLQGGGGGGSDPVRVVMMVAVAALAVYTGGLAAAAWGTWAGAAVGVGVSMVGNMLVNAMLPISNSASWNFGKYGETASSTYSLSAQGNQARLGQPIPVIYGRHIIYPDFASTPYTEYANNEQYLYQLHCIGQGYYDIENIMIDDTPIASFDEVEYEVINPSETISLFNPDVITAPECAGQELVNTDYVGAFVVNPSDADINYIGIDILFERGLYYMNDAGTLTTLSASWQVEARLIDEDGLPLDDAEWIVLGTQTYSAATNTPVRLSYKYAVAEGRYEVRVIRIDAKNTSARAGHELRWGGLRGYVAAQSDFGNITLLAIKMRATDNLSSRSSKLINCIVNRKIPVYDADNGWSEPQATRSIAWAFCDICRAEYGAKLTDARLDMDELLRLDALWTSRGDYFDAIFDSQSTIWDALQKVSRPGRAVPYQQGGIIRIARDEQKSYPVQMFNPRNIVKDSLSIEYLMPSDDTADCVVLEYYNNKTWTESEVEVALPESTKETKATVSLFGCTDKAQALREAKYIVADNAYRRKLITFQTDLEGFICTYGDLVGISYDFPGYNSGGEIVKKDGMVLTLSEPITYEDGKKYYVALRAPNGTPSPLIECNVISKTEIEITELPNFEIYTGGDKEKTYFAFGEANSVFMLAKVKLIKPRGENFVELTCVYEDNRVHTAEVDI